MQYRKIRLVTIFIFVIILMYSLYNYFTHGSEMNIAIILLAIYSIVKQAHLVYKGE